VDSGEPFIMEMGRSDYYTDPWYRKLIIQAGGHNCVLIDDNPESQRAGDFRHDVPAWHRFAEITDFIEFNGGGFVSGRLDPLYRGKLSYLRRSVLFVEPRTVVLVDEIRATPQAKSVALRIHSPTRDDITIEGSETRISRPSGVLIIRTVAPADYEAAVRKRPLTLHEFRAEDSLAMKARGFLELSTKLAGRATTFVNVLSTDPSVISGLDAEMKSGLVVLSIGGRRYHINTGIANDDGIRAAEGDAASDALVYARTPNGYIAMRATTLEVRGGRVFTAGKPISIAIREGPVPAIAYSAHEETKLTLALPHRPERVSLDGEDLDSWSFAPQTGLVIGLPAGNGVLRIW